MGNKNMGYNSPFAIHPGETIKDALEYNSMSQNELSLRTGISEKTISLILNGKEPVTADTALKLERVLEVDQNLLVSMQARYGADLTRLAEKNRLENEIPYLERYKCYLELAKLGYVEQTRDKKQKVENLLRFFNVNSLKFVPNVMQASFKRTIDENIDKYALTSWLRIGEIEAGKKQIPEYNRKKLLENIPLMRKLTNQPETFSKKLIDLCEEAGVILMYMPHLKKTKVNGATYWLNDNPVIQMSLYNVFADIFWFAFFHEVGHVLKHGKKESFMDIHGKGILNGNNVEEQEANKFSQKVLIPDEQSFSELKNNLDRVNVKSKITKYAKEIDVHPGIVAGRVGRDLGAWQFVSALRSKLLFTNK